MPNAARTARRLPAADLVGASMTPIVDRDWDPRTNGIEADQLDALIAQLLPTARRVDIDVAWRLECRHVDFYGDPAADSRTAALRCDLLIREQAALERSGRRPYDVWLELHRDGADQHLRDRAAVLRHLARHT